MEFKYLDFEKKDRIGILSFNRPEVLNALNTQVLEEVSSTLTWLEARDDLDVLVITGRGKAFIAGADIKEMHDKTPEEARKFAGMGHGVFKQLEGLSMPTIAAVNGFALGGGCELAMACDIRLASEKAKFGQPEVGLGITPGFAGTQRLSRLVGIAKAKEMIFTGKVISADQAKALGLVNEVYAGACLLQAAIDMGQAISQNAQGAVRYAKAAINKGFDIDFESASEIEKTYFALCFARQDQKEGMAAFIERRPAHFKNT